MLVVSLDGVQCSCRKIWAGRKLIDASRGGAVVSNDAPHNAMSAQCVEWHFNIMEHMKLVFHQQFTNTLVVVKNMSFLVILSNHCSNICVCVSLSTCMYFSPLHSAQLSSADTPTHSRWLKVRHKTEFHFRVCVCVCARACVGRAWVDASVVWRRRDCLRWERQVRQQHTFSRWFTREQNSWSVEVPSNTHNNSKRMVQQTQGQRWFEAWQRTRTPWWEEITSCFGFWRRSVQSTQSWHRRSWRETTRNTRRPHDVIGISKQLSVFYVYEVVSTSGATNRGNSTNWSCCGKYAAVWFLPLSDSDLAWEGQIEACSSEWTNPTQKSCVMVGESWALFAISNARSDAETWVPLRTLGSKICRQSFACWSKRKHKNNNFRPIPPNRNETVFGQESKKIHQQ